MRPLTIACLGMLCLSATTGCSLMQEGQKTAKATVDSLKPDSGGYADNNNEDYVDEWSAVGQEGRGDRPLEKESDTLTPYISSPKARAIEKSLGYE